MSEQLRPGAASVPPDWAAIREAIQAVGQRWLWGQSPRLARVAPLRAEYAGAQEPRGEQLGMALP